MKEDMCGIPETPKFEDLCRFLGHGYEGLLQSRWNFSVWNAHGNTSDESDEVLEYGP